MNKEQHFTLSESEKASLMQLAVSYGNDMELYTHANEESAKLASQVEAILSADMLATFELMREGKGPEVITVSNLPYDQDVSWEQDLNDRVAQKTRVSEVCLLGINGLLDGEFQEEKTSHQLGYIHQVTPVPNFLGEASGRGGGSIPFHAENMFIKDSPAFLSLFCIYGEKGVATEYLYVSDIIKRLDDATIEQLKQPVYTITSGDGFARKELTNTPVLDEFDSGWVVCRLYEEDRIFSNNAAGKQAIEKLHKAIEAARDADTKAVELTSGTLLLVSNAVRKQAFGGVLHGRKGNMTTVNQSPTKTNGQRWLQRVCIGVSDGYGEREEVLQ